jgi:ferrous iron transport protein B
VTLQRRARQIAAAATVSETAGRRWAHALDAVALHPVAGPLLLVTILFVMFQAVFTWATVPADAIDAGFGALQDAIKSALPDGFVRSLLTDGLIAGVGAVIVFLPQILILFLFILVLESSGYMVRAAFLMDRLMATVGLSGRAFIPLLSSFACAVPGIMATRVIDDEKDRLTTILIAPLMTCSARWPVYTLIIGAMIPNTPLLPFVRLQGVVMFGLLITGIAATTVVLWLLLSFPKPPEGSGISPVDYSVAGRIGHGIEYVVKPIGFNRDIALALLPAMAAREVAVSAIGTVYAIDDKDGSGTDRITDQIRGRWTLPTALAFLMWFVFAPQCISTIAVTRRETNGWKWPLFMVGYLFAAAYVMAGITFWLATFAGL